MKHLLSISLLLFSVFSFSQVEKDSLFKKDAALIYDTLKVMHHLERAVMQYYLMPEQDRISTGQNFQEYIEANVLATNPVPDVDLLRFLEIYIKKDVPQDWKNFMAKVNNTNAKMLLTLTHKYGYPSKQRVEKYAGAYNLPNASVIFAVRPNRYYDEMAKMLKKAHKKGDLSDHDYDLFLAIGGREAISTNEVKKIEGHTRFTIGEQ
ncbi:hypothetical protein R1T16_06565 [Flavobacterium sp. DG1-102-2]|uniref:hypothetical protein n=1 Tax=Flavobacterium sp. DG1-102-2 TaxID=3081663 RepID=UPI00294A40A0|nr:hypothetical protein [Flavobacterium sp. DG1-102-2]MDV6168081.1 hypothetical protein [Flavobacterium sp. DG1-102-2]